MVPNAPEERIEQATAILEQLLKYTSQLAAFENDREVDVGALSRACTQRIEDLKQLLPEGGLSTHPRVRELFRELHTQTQICTEMLEGELARIASGIDSLAKTKRAIRSYSS
jgi:hypothetical protein